MNGQNVNNNGENNNLESLTLGVQDTQTEVLNNENVVNEPVAKPIPGTENGQEFSNLTGNTIGVGGNYNQNTINNFASTTQANIGQMPPSNTTPKKEKKFNKVLFVVLILVLMAGIAFFVYYFLNISNKVKLSVKDVNLNLGDIVPSDVQSYAIVQRGDVSSCSVNTRGVDTKTIGKYKVVIACGKDTYEVNVNVSDISAPKATLNAIFRPVGSEVVVEDFVSSCIDPSNCVTEIENMDEVNTYLETAGGPYKVKILAKDDLDNQTTYETDLYVTDGDIYLYLNCVSEEVDYPNFNAKKTVSDYLPIKLEEFKFFQVARRDYIYTFNTIEDFNAAVGGKDTIITFDSITGLASYDEEEKTLRISTDLSMDTLSKENNGVLPTNYTEVQTMYTSKGITPQYKMAYPELVNTGE